MGSWFRSLGFLPGAKAGVRFVRTEANGASPNQTLHWKRLREHPDYGPTENFASSKRLKVGLRKF